MEDLDKMRSGFGTEEDLKQLIALEQRLEKNPNDTDALLKKGILYYEPFLRTDESIAIFRSIIAKDPQNVDAYFWLAKCIWHYRCDFIEAERLLSMALTIDPNRADCHSLLGIVLEEIIDDSLNRETQPKSALIKLEKSIESHYLKAIELEPSWIIPRHRLAYKFLEKGEYQGARSQIIEALKYVTNNDTPNITDSIVEHYETFVTGRYHQELVKENLLNFLKEIDKAIEQREIVQKQA